MNRADELPTKRRRARQNPRAETERGLRSSRLRAPARPPLAQLLELDASEAPESCGALYWDPLLASITFEDGTPDGAPDAPASPPASSDEAPALDSLVGPIAGAVGGTVGLLLAVGVVFYWRKRRKSPPGDWKGGRV